MQYRVTEKNTSIHHCKSKYINSFIQNLKLYFKFIELKTVYMVFISKSIEIVV